MPDHDAHDIIVLFSARSRDAYAAEATKRGETYTFTDAWGLPRTWIKGEYAYLAPNAAGLLLARCNLKHHLVEEAALDTARLSRCRALLIPNAGHLALETIARIEAWLRDGDCRLIVTGKTNLPPRLLGLQACEPAPVQGYTGWRWRPGSRFAGDAWEPLYVSGYNGHPAHRIVPAEGSRVLADLVELSGDLSDATTAMVGELGPAIVLTDKTVYVANQVFELIGGMMQAHLNVEAVRHWANATHWGDTLLFFLRGLMREIGLSSLWQTRLRSFGTYDGVLSFRHDVHGMRDYTFLDYQIQNLIPASYDIEDPTFSTNIDEAMARDWVERTTQHSFIEPALHNDSSIGDPPTAIFGKGLFEHVSKAGKSLGITICTCGRHAGGHMHPETIDAMDYLYAQDKTILGLCTFCYYHMIEYGVRDPNVMVGGTIGEKPLTYVTDVRRTIATSGIWFPFRPVVTTTAEWRKLRGWDRTHEYDAAYELVETIFAGHSSRRPGVDDKLENGVYSFQYHPELARDPSVNNGKGTLDYVRYCINLAERSNYWIATQAELYQRMADYEGLGFDVRDGGRTVTISNPTDRRISAMMIEQRLPFGSVWLGDDELIHVADGAFVTVPPLDPGASATLRFKPETVEAVLVRQPSNKGLVVLDARHDPRSGEARITLSVCRQQPLSIEGVDPEGVYRVQIDNQPPQDVAVRTVRTIQALLSEKTDAAQGRSRRAVTSGTTRFLDLLVEGEENRFVERTLRIRQLPADEARPIRRARIANGDTGDVACDHYHRYKEDVALMRCLGLQVYRFSVAWPRVLPQGRGQANSLGLDFYDRLIDELLRSDIEPWLCLYHWDLPQALDDLGGWQNRDIALWFADYAALMARRYGDRVRHFATFNEPNVCTLFGYGMGWNAPGIANRRSFLQAAHHVNLAHGEAVRTLRATAPGALLGAIYNRQAVLPISTAPQDAVAAGILDACWNRLYADPQCLAQYPPELAEGLQEFIQPGDMACIAQPIDWLGLNHYCPIYARADPGQLGFAWADAPHDVPLTGVGWRIDPDAFRNEVIATHRRYKLPVYITENGYGAHETLDAAGGVNDGGRIAYLADYTKALEQAVASGADVRGYFLWSLLDNLEWGAGFASRFGIVFVDYATQKRVPKASFDWFAALIRAQQK